MKKISRRIKRTLALVLAAVMVLSTDAPFTLLEAMVANAEELVPDREKMPEVASETEADDPDEDDNSGGNDDGQPPADNSQDGDDDSNVIVDNNINDDMLVASKGQLLSAKKQARANEYLVPSDEYADIDAAFNAIEEAGISSATIVLTEDLEIEGGELGVKGAKITYTSDNAGPYEISFGSEGSILRLVGDTVFDDVVFNAIRSSIYACCNYIEITEKCGGTITNVYGNDPESEDSLIEPGSMVINGTAEIDYVYGIVITSDENYTIKGDIKISASNPNVLYYFGVCGFYGYDRDNIVVNGDISINYSGTGSQSTGYRMIYAINGAMNAIVNGDVFIDISRINSFAASINGIYDAEAQNVNINIKDGSTIASVTPNVGGIADSSEIVIYDGEISGVNASGFDTGYGDNSTGSFDLEINGGEIGAIYAYSFAYSSVDTSSMHSDLDSSHIEISGGKVSNIYLADDNTFVSGDSEVLIKGGEVTSITGYPDDAADKKDYVAGDNGISIVYEGCGSNSDGIESDEYLYSGSIKNVDRIEVTGGSNVALGEVSGTDHTLIDEASSVLIGDVLEIPELELIKGSELVFAGSDAAINAEIISGSADIYTAGSMPSASDGIVTGLTEEDFDDERVLMTSTDANSSEAAEPNSTSTAFSLLNDGVDCIQYVADGAGHKWLVKEGIRYTIDYYLDDEKLDDPSSVDGLTTEGVGVAGKIADLDPPVHISKDGTRYTLDKDKTDLTPELSDTDNVFEVYYATDINGDDVPDYKQAYVRFDLGEDPFDAEFTDISATNIVTSEDHIDVWYTVDESPVYVPVPITDKDAFLEGWFDGDVEYSSVLGDTVELTAGSSRTFTARWMSGDEIKLTPYDTTIYVGGSSDLNSSGFPGLELRVDAISDSGEAVSRPVIEENVESIIIDGIAQLDADIDKYLRVMYIGADQEASLDDSEPGIYTAKVVLTDDVVKPATGISTYGLAREAQTEGIYEGDDPLAASHEIYINGRKAQFADAQLIVRHVSDTEAARTDAMYRDIFTEEGTVAADGAVAVIPSSSVIYTNDPKDGRVVDSRDGIRLFVDNLLSEGEDDSREGLLIAKANQLMGIDMTADEARTAGYHYVIRYMDLVDTKNGNAWVSSSEGTDVYLPYQTDTTKDTEFRVIHFEELHREYGITGPAVEEAIAASNAVIMDATNTDYGIKFHTDVEGFSPFALVWHESGSFEDDVPGADDDDHESSAPVSVGSGSSSSNDTYFTVGVTGNWKHMDNVDVNAELDEPVPAGADPISSPEWHRWKFFRSNGIMLYNQWAHIDNPFAVEGQPRTGWFYFDGNGLMRYGWYLDTRSGDWYYMHSKSDGMLGTMMTGWHYDESDGKWYYLDPSTGAMATGWRQIDGKWYYFNPTPYGETWTLDHGTSVWRFNQSSIRPYGSMYQDEITPDGYRVGSDGAWIQ